MKRLLSNIMNPNHSHHVQSMLFGVFTVTLIIWLAVQIAQINTNFHSINEIEKQNVILQERIQLTNEVLIKLKQVDTDQQHQLKLFEEYYARDLENQKMWNDNFVTDEELQLEVQRCIENTEEIE